MLHYSLRTTYQTMENKKAYGKVYLVGAGPGDAGLLTIKGRDCIAEADVILYDALVSDEIMAYCRPECETVFVGKRAGKHSLIQEEINALLLDHASKNNKIVRLKGGDPFVFGRGGEEALFLSQNGVSFEIVPGVTSGVAVPAYAGIPITHRGYATSVTFVTGHVSKSSSPKRNWTGLANLTGTLVFFMGVHNLTEISAELIEHGKDPKTPAAIIRNGTRADQETLTGTLEDIAAKVAEVGFAPPALVVIGKVADLATELAWFQQD